MNNPQPHIISLPPAAVTPAAVQAAFAGYGVSLTADEAAQALEFINLITGVVVEEFENNNIWQQ